MVSSLADHMDAITCFMRLRAGEASYTYGHRAVSGRREVSLLNKARKLWLPEQVRDPRSDTAWIIELHRSAYYVGRLSMAATRHSKMNTLHLTLNELPRQECSTVMPSTSITATYKTLAQGPYMCDSVSIRHVVAMWILAFADRRVAEQPDYGADAKGGMCV